MVSPSMKEAVVYDTHMADLSGMSLSELRHSTDPALLRSAERLNAQATRDGLSILQNQPSTPDGELIRCDGQSQLKPDTCGPAC